MHNHSETSLRSVGSIQISDQKGLSIRSEGVIPLTGICLAQDGPMFVKNVLKALDIVCTSDICLLLTMKCFAGVLVFVLLMTCLIIYHDLSCFVFRK